MVHYGLYSLVNLGFCYTVPSRWHMGFHTTLFFCVNILTILIITRLLTYRRHVVRAFIDNGQHYVFLATIVIEFAALYSVFALLFIITYDNPINQIFLTIASSQVCISSASRFHEGGDVILLI